METPATLLAIPLPTSCFSDQYWSLAPHWLPTAGRGAALWARVKPGAWRVVTGWGDGGVQGPLASLLTHSAKLILLESPHTPPSEPSVPSEGVP